MARRLMYLVDTNIWLERLLNQNNSEVVGELLDKTPLDQLFISDFSLHSICAILTKLKRNQLLIEFIDDVLIDGEIRLLSTHPAEIVLVVDIMERFNIDFDDGYQYVIAEQHNLEIISFDRDFDKTPLGRKTPAKILAGA